MQDKPKLRVKIVGFTVEGTTNISEGWSLQDKLSMVMRIKSFSSNESNQTASVCPLLVQYKEEKQPLDTIPLGLADTVDCHPRFYCHWAENSTSQANFF